MSSPESSTLPIDRVVYINLDRRTDRRAEIEEELRKLNLASRAVRFPAIAHTCGAYGCAASHLAVLKAARDDPAVQTLLVLEDDFQITAPASEVLRALHVVLAPDAPAFDGVMLAVNAREYEPAKDVTTSKGTVRLSRVRRGWTTAGYIVTRRAFDALIAVWEYHLPLLLVHNIEPNRVDVSWNAVQRSGHWVMFEPRFARQRPSYSDIEHAFVDYSSCGA